jgi:hypothetical protein
LEYLVKPHPEVWETVVRYDHDAEGSDEATHDVTEDGLHIDIYRDGEKIDSHELTPPLQGTTHSTPPKNIWPSICKVKYGDLKDGTGSTHD